MSAGATDSEEAVHHSRPAEQEEEGRQLLLLLVAVGNIDDKRVDLRSRYLHQARLLVPARSTLSGLPS